MKKSNKGLPSLNGLGNFGIMPIPNSGPSLDGVLDQMLPKYFAPNVLADIAKKRSNARKGGIRAADQHPIQSDDDSSD